MVPDQGPVEQFAAAGLHPAFHDRVHSGRLDPAEYRFDACVSEDGVDQAGELAVAVPDQEPRLLPASWRSMTRFLAAWATQDALG